jgi:LexA-binding, inner membrane-associated putative hydrolase
VVLGHLTVTAAVHREVQRHWPALPVTLGVLLVGAYLPDLLDKPIGFATGLSSRGYGHSIVVIATLGSFGRLLNPRHRRLVGVLALGAVVHLLEDWVEARVLFAPLLGAIAVVPRRNIWEGLLAYYRSGSALVWMEGIAIVYWVAVGIARLARGHEPRTASSGPATG